MTLRAELPWDRLDYSILMCYNEQVKAQPITNLEYVIKQETCSQKISDQSDMASAVE